MSGRPAEVLATAPVAPPVVELGRLAGWSPLPLSVRDARRRAGDLTRAAALPPRRRSTVRAVAPATWWPTARGLVVRYAGAGGPPALRGVDLRLRAGEVVALMGRNGAGKSTLLSALVGLRRPDAGSVTVAGADPAALAARDLVRRVGMVPQEPGDLLYADTVAEECDQADRDAGVATPAPHSSCFDGLVGPASTRSGIRGTCPRASGSRSRWPWCWPADRRCVLLDEPTRGLDYPGKAALVVTLRDLAADGHAVVLATHDVELAADRRRPHRGAGRRRGRQRRADRARSWCRRPRSRRRSPRCSRRCPG